ncbi:MAG: hypothetical protein K1060chlam5_00864 [Candidatus Anoxychlamydiales bacterium]|nr:hypothetical protein [Candidatus Anoxychlamydiales bacterium]
MFIINSYDKGKPSSETAIESEKITLFDDKVSPDGVVFGGRILDLVHFVALKVANTHAEIDCIIKGIDFVRYYSPVKKDDRLICKASVNRVWQDIIEVGAKVVAENFRSLEQTNILSAYFSFTKKDNDQMHVVSQVIPETEVDKRRFLEADIRRKIREKRLKNKF